MTLPADRSFSTTTPATSLASTIHGRGASTVEEEVAAEWIAAMLGTKESLRSRKLGGPQPASPKTDGESDGEGGQERAGGESPGHSAHQAESHPADTPSVNEANEGRLILDVNSETLGQVKLIIDREEGGIRVLVGSDPQARSRLCAGKHTLKEALEGAGMRVDALRFVQHAQVGTVLAQDLVNQRTHQGSATTARPEKKGSGFRLNLIG